MSSRSESKIREGLQYLAAAEKCIKTSLFKWSADWEGAASDYSKAAKSYEQAALMLKELNCIDEAVDLLKQASSMLSEHGSPASAAQALNRAAKICEATKAETAIDLYLRACELHKIEEKSNEAVECVGKAARLQLKLKKYTNVLGTMQQQCELYQSMEKFPSVFRAIIAMVIVYLKLGDKVAADNCFRSATEYPGFDTSEEGALIENLLDSITEGDSETFQKCIRNPIILHNDNEIAKLARDLRPPTVVLPDSNASSTGNALEPDDNNDDDVGDALN
ncbi:uncharacterized protein TRIADDRAFT_55641 [Trichoplax adhaerens]|uniref:Gamma-soluble NSF attachment protein n=1 Tax=Trichoplax adhaerens TaxID=10228 RepID=B3RVG3_TRIAD|nr:hypothetical protein TRIADDRAFT_55641 [Trichoplax adhaerens]EDV25990.1 hypothetical protein TRIADDRAFT_55641 [Trichoplax adhaerens]|eukprot:XP_002112023.1 hypothetical protein TRIADDRAFT_55641 [Trichoplax adhaerens]